MVHNIIYALEILFLLLGILLACQVFTNAIENLGDKLNLSHEFTGSILAAVGTALPETILPLVAIYLASQSAGASIAAKNEIAIGAIVGAPFMLATLAMLLLGLSIINHPKKRKEKFGDPSYKFLQVNNAHLKRDLIFFLIIFSSAIAIAFFKLNDGFTKIVAVAFIILAYIVYLIWTYKSSSEEIGDEEDETPKLYLTRVFAKNKEEASMFLVISQTLLGLVGIVFFAHHFVHMVEHIADIVAISPLVLSLIISPIATELPEKVNSWIWSGSGKDTLAIGNLSGAMVFQAAIPCAIGIGLTPWQLDELSIVCSSFAIVSSVILLITLQFSHKLNYKTLIFVGSFYLLYLVYIFMSL